MSNVGPQLPPLPTTPYNPNSGQGSSGPPTVVPGSGTPVTPMPTRGEWANSLLKLCGFPVNTETLLAIVTWETAENTQASFNPLATTLVYGDASNLAGNLAGVQNYGDEQTGLKATQATLFNTGGGATYAGVRTALGNGNSASAILTAVEASPWASGNYGGSLLSLMATVQANYNQYSQLPIDNGATAGGNIVTPHNPLSGIFGSWSGIIIKVLGILLAAVAIVIGVILVTKGEIPKTIKGVINA